MKSTNHVVLGSFLFFAVCVTTEAAEWVEVAVNKNTAVYVDVTSMRRDGQKVKVWQKWVHAERIDIPYRPDPRVIKTHLSLKALSIYDCANRASITLQTTYYYDGDTSEIAESFVTPESSKKFKEVAPETIGEALLDVETQT